MISKYIYWVVFVYLPRPFIIALKGQRTYLIPAFQRVFSLQRWKTIGRLIPIHLTIFSAFVLWRLFTRIRMSISFFFRMINTLFSKYEWRQYKSYYVFNRSTPGVISICVLNVWLNQSIDYWLNMWVINHWSFHVKKKWSQLPWVAWQ